MTTAMSIGTFLNLFRKVRAGSTEAIGQFLQLARPDLLRLANRFIPVYLNDTSLNAAVRSTCTASFQHAMTILKERENERPISRRGLERSP